NNTSGNLCFIVSLHAGASARQVGAIVWELHQYNLPFAKMHKSGGGGGSRRNHSLRRHVAASLMQHHWTVQRNHDAVRAVLPVSYGSSSMEVAHNPAVTPTSSIEFRGAKGDTNREVPVNETFHVQTDDELTENELKQIEADDQAIQTILLGLPEDIYAAFDSFETAQVIWLRVQQMMKCSDIEIQEKKAKLFNEWERSHTLALMAKAFKLYYSTPTNNNQRISSNPRNRQIAQPGMNMGQDRQMQMVGGNGENQFRQYAGQNIGNLNGYNAVQNVENQARTEGNAAGHNGNQIRCYNCRGVGHFARNCTQASTSSTQTDKAPVYDSNESAKYTELLELIPEPHQVPHNDNNITFEDSSVEQSGETVEQHPVNFKATRALYDSVYQNLAIEVEKVNTVNRKLKETNADLTAELARFKNQGKCFEISQ
nr:hypothetical protein [Tanacetum cinerariifolium]